MYIWQTHRTFVQCCEPHHFKSLAHNRYDFVIYDVDIMDIMQNSQLFASGASRLLADCVVLD